MNKRDLLPLDEAIAIRMNFAGHDLSGPQRELYERAFATVRHHAEQAMAKVDAVRNPRLINSNDAQTGGR